MVFITEMKSVYRAVRTGDLNVIQIVVIRYKMTDIMSILKTDILGLMCGPGSSVGIATTYGLDGPGIESR